ncbi:MAG: lysostaphin resistance A-like protein [Clostridiaceae bacterium]
MKFKNVINRLKEKYTLLLSILILIIYLASLNIAGFLVSFSSISNLYTLQLLAECVGIIVAILIMHLLGKTYVLKERSVGILRGIFIGGFLFVICLIASFGNLINSLLTENVYKLLPLPQIIIFIATMIGIGISEEFIFRGVILNLFIDKFSKTPKGIYASVIVSSLIFGSAHMTNALSGISLKGVFIQAMGASVLGALLAAIYLRTRNIWVVVFLHGFMDFSALLGSGLFGIGSIYSDINDYGYIKLVGMLIYLIPTLVLLRREKTLEILKTLETKEVDKCDKESIVEI